MLSHGYWQQHFGGDPNVIGRNILLDGVDRQIIGVAPKGIQFPDAETQFWMPISFKAGDIHDLWAIFGFRAIGRLKDGVAAEPRPGRIALLSLPDAYALSVDYAR